MSSLPLHHIYGVIMRVASVFLIPLVLSGNLIPISAGTLTKSNCPDSIIIVISPQDKRPAIQFTAPKAILVKEQAFPVSFPLKECATYTAGQINAEFSKRIPRVIARVNDGISVTLSASGTDKKAVQHQLDNAKVFRDQSNERFRNEKGYTLLEGGVCENHALFAVESAPALRGLVSALGGPQNTPRDFAKNALSFVQSFRYDANVHGFRKPLATLAADRGDCDSKSTLFLALMRAAYPTIEGGIVYIKGHAFAALAIPVKRGDNTIRSNGKNLVVMEPVGPAQLPIGTVSRKSASAIRWGRFTIREM